MCMGKNCKRRDECYRFVATPDSYWQSYMEFDNDPDNCKYFMNIFEPREKK